ncbi:hypothetical protein D8674_013628 [Pyrus ussuriensis x Pyrus communis]|uniref:Uncharacterized protein n=1 Tax=Pyrus ussuriensis x Pyrus communis TaxID=2448454 RepID=A0A5N5GQC0_9ROSA|nr:hypothetical protein D8674_013628 [Pyrus ussuriensis x Pyrus communis]
MAAVPNIAADDEQERVLLDEDFASDADELEEEQEEDEEEEVSLCDLPVNLIKQDQTQFSNLNLKSESSHVAIEKQDQEFDFCSSKRGGLNNLLADTKMCAADEVFFQGQILPLRLSISSDTHSNRPTSQCPLSGVGLRSSSCRSRSSHNSSFSSSTSSTNTTTTTGIASKPRATRPRNQFYTEPSPKLQIKIPNSRLEKAGSRHHKSSMWDFFRLGLVRTPDMELQDFNKVLRSNCSTSTRANNNARNSVSRNSSVSSTNSTSFISSYNNAASAISGLKSENLKQKKQSFFSSVHGCKCSIETVASDNVIFKSRSSSGRSTSASHINEDGGVRAAAAASMHAASEEKVAIELKMMTRKNNKKQQQSCKQKEKQALSHHRTYEWLKQQSHANSPFPVHV